jgi:2-C-methyl-D-erythritol 4-phosphate cytidylyltransferase
MRGVVRDKILEPLAGIPVIAHSVKAFIESEVIDGFVIVCRDDEQQAEITNAIQPWLTKDVPLYWARGGKERQDSVLNGLECCPENTSIVFIHDSARPLVQKESLIKLADTALLNGAGVLAHRVKDTIKQVPPQTKPGISVDHVDLDRSTLWAMETPQVFRHSLILAAYRKIITEKIPITDDVAAATHAGHKVALVENLHPNPKITDPHDLLLVEFLLKQKRI